MPAGRHSAGSIRKPAKRPVAQAQRQITAPPTTNRMHARRSGGASSRPILITTVLAPQRTEMSTATAAPLRSMSFEGWLRTHSRIRHLA